VKVPVFPHLATLRRQNYQLFDFGGTQETARQLAGLSAELDKDAVIYSHSESFRQLCANCWRDPGIDHDHQETIEKHVVRGRIATPPDITPSDLLARIDEAVAKHEHCRLYAPDLCAAAGLTEREQIERRRFDLLMSN
jgi:hypothetical protein